MLVRQEQVTADQDCSVRRAQRKPAREATRGTKKSGIEVRRFLGCAVIVLLLGICWTSTAVVAKDATYVWHQTDVLTVGPGAGVKVTVKIKHERDDVVPTSGETWILVNGCTGYVKWTRGGAVVETCPLGVKMPGNSEVFYFYPTTPCPASGQCEYSIFVHYLGSKYCEECSETITIYGIKHLTEVTIPTCSCTEPNADGTRICSVTVNVEDKHPDVNPTSDLVRTVPTGWVELYTSPGEHGKHVGVLSLTADITKPISTCTFPGVMVQDPCIVYAKYTGDIMHSESASSADLVNPPEAARVIDVAGLCLNDGNACKQLDRALSLYGHIGAIVCAWMGAIPDGGTGIAGILSAACTTEVEVLQLAAEQAAMDHCHDVDGDGLSDYVETVIGTERYNSDTDFDGLSDGEEIGWADGLVDTGSGVPCAACPCPKERDSDGDYLDDGDELLIYQTSFCRPDTDGDGIRDVYELATGRWDVALQLPSPHNPELHYSSDPRNHANPLAVDTDGDGLPDIEEWFFANTTYRDGYVNCADSDGDGILDGNEAFEDVPGVHGTDGELNDDSLPSIWDPDSDNDGLNDGEEVDLGTDPLDWDSDDDGLSDLDETRVHHTNPIDPDCDNDGLTDGAEILEHRTDPWDADTDDDHATDAEEVAHVCAPPPASYLVDPTDPQRLKPGVRQVDRLDPLNPDSDGDGEVDAFDECPCFSPPTPVGSPGAQAPDPSRDSDGDGTSDADEAAAGTNPYDPTDHPDVPFTADLDLDGLVDDSLLLVDSDGNGFADEIEIDIGDNSHIDTTVPVGPGQLTVGAAKAGTAADALYVVRYTLPIPSSSDPVAFQTTIRDLAHDLIVDSVEVARISLDADGDSDGIPDAVENAIGTDPNDESDVAAIFYADLDKDGESDDGLWVAWRENDWPSRAIVLLDIGRTTFTHVEIESFTRWNYYDMNDDGVFDMEYMFSYDLPMSLSETTAARRFEVDVVDYCQDGVLDSVSVDAVE